MEHSEEAVSRRGKVAGHVFISYVREDSHRVDQLQRILQAAGLPVWRDTADLWPGEDWRTKIRRAITDNALVFIACFSRASLARDTSYQNEELTLAIEQMRLRRPDDPWLIPVRFDDCEIPDWDIGGGRTLMSNQRADLLGDGFDDGAARLVGAILRILGEHADGGGADEDRKRDALASAITDRWRFTTDDGDVPFVARIGSKTFDHPAYSRPDWPPYMRVQAVVACNPLGDGPGSQELRSRFRGLLAQAPFNELLRDMYVISPGIVWLSRAAGRRSHLEADLSYEDNPQHPLGTLAMLLPDWKHPQDPPQASAMLLLPEADRNYAELTLHADFPMISYLALPDWNRRVTYALQLAGELANFLTDDLGLTTSNNPAAQVAILLRTRHTMLGLVNPIGVKVLPSSRIEQEFTASAVADPAGKTAAEVAGKIVLELSERVLHLEGSEAELSGLAGSSTNPDSLHFPPVGGGSLCPCGSNKKFKSCHGSQAWQAWESAQS
jgi:TIR domain/SEC-C motif